MREGGGNYLKYLKRGWNRTKLRGTKILKRGGGKLGQGMSALKRGGTGTHLQTTLKKRAVDVGRGAMWLGPDKSNILKIEGLSDICRSLFFRDSIFFSRYYTKYAIKIKPP